MKYLLLLLFIISPNLTAVQLNGSILDLWPFGYINEVTGNPDGKYPSLIKAIERETGYKLSYQITPLKRINHYLTEEKTDFTMLFLRDEYKNNVDIVTNVEDLSWFVLFSMGVPTSVNAETKIGAVLGEEGLASKAFSTMGVENISMTTTKSHVSLFKMLAAKRIDVAFYVGDGFEKFLKEKNLSRDDFGEKQLLQTRNVFFFLNKTSKMNTPEISKTLRDAINKLKDSGELDQILSYTYTKPQ